MVKVNIDQNQQTPRTYGVRGIPTLMVFKNGKVAPRLATPGLTAVRRAVCKAALESCPELRCNEAPPVRRCLYSAPTLASWARECS